MSPNDKLMALMLVCFFGSFAVFFVGLILSNSNETVEGNGEETNEESFDADDYETIEIE